MDLILHHFRCYRNQTFHFPTGVILIDGPSGKGKTTLLLAIKYAIFGTVKSVTTFGEKKTSVELRTHGMTITRTTVPSRLVVRTEEKDYEDDAAQGFLYRIFGPPDQFEVTSYMMQKSTETFFSMSGAQKLHLLEQLSLLGEQDIQQMKESIQRDTKEKKKQAEKLEHQVELLRSQVGNEPTFVKKYGFSTVSDVYHVVGFLQAVQKNWLVERARCDQLLFEYTASMMKQQDQRLQYEQMNASLRFVTEEYQRVQQQFDAIQIPDEKRQLFLSYKVAHEKWVQYTQRSSSVEEEQRLFQHWFSVEQSSYERIEQEWKNCQIDESAYQTYQGYQVQHEKWIAYQKHSMLLKEKESQFQKWLAEKQSEFETFQKEWNDLTIDILQLEGLESSVVQHEQFLSYEKKTGEVQMQQEQFDQWLSLQMERYQHWKEERDSLQIDETRKIQYEGYVQHQEQYELFVKQQQLVEQQQQHFHDWLLEAKATYDKVKAEYDALYVSPETIAELEQVLKQHEQYETYQQAQKQVAEKQSWYQRVVASAIETYDKELSELESKRITSDHIVQKEEWIEKRNKATGQLSICKRITELRKKRPEQEVDLQLDTLKKNKEIMERFFTNLDARKNILPCPQCKTGLVIQSQKIQLGNSAPLTEADLKKEEEYKVKLPKVVEKYDKNYREWISREEDKKEIELLLKEVGDCTEESCVAIINECTTLLQEEYAREQSQLQLEETIRTMKQHDPRTVYQSQREEIDLLQEQLQRMEKGSVSVSPIEEIKRLLHDDTYRMERYRSMKVVVPEDTVEYKQKKSKIDAIVAQCESLRGAEPCPISMEEVRDTLRDMKRKQERLQSMAIMEEPTQSSDYKKRHKSLQTFQRDVAAMDKGVCSSTTITEVQQQIWDMKSKRDRQVKMKKVVAPEELKEYNKLQQELVQLRQTVEVGEIEKGMESPIAIDTLQQSLFEMKSCLLRQSQLKRLPNPETTAEYQTRMEKLEQVQASLASMDKGTESPVAIDEVMTQLDVWNVQVMEQKHYQQRMNSLQHEIDMKQRECADIVVDQNDYQALIEETKREHTWITERIEQPVEQIKIYTEYAESMKQYMKYRTVIMDIHEKNRMCAIYYSQLEQLEALHQHMIQAEGICLEQFLRRVNQKMNNYMEHFFPDASLKMELCTEKETKSGKIKNEICVVLSQNNHPTELKHLSGGEYDRCSLAFMLAINELSHSPFLFLDESISSLDMALSEDVLEIIKEKQTELKKTVLLISHQANTGFFDHVIKI